MVYEQMDVRAHLLVPFYHKIRNCFTESSDKIIAFLLHVRLPAFILFVMELAITNKWECKSFSRAAKICPCFTEWPVKMRTSFAAFPPGPLASIRHNFP